MSRVFTQPNINFCILTAQSVCVFARVNDIISVQRKHITILKWLRWLSLGRSSPPSEEGGDMICQ